MLQYSVSKITTLPLVKGAKVSAFPFPGRHPLRLCLWLFNENPYIGKPHSRVYINETHGMSVREMVLFDRRHAIVHYHRAQNDYVPVLRLAPAMVKYYLPDLTASPKDPLGLLRSINWKSEVVEGRCVYLSKKKKKKKLIVFNGQIQTVEVEAPPTPTLLGEMAVAAMPVEQQVEDFLDSVEHMPDSEAT